MEQSRGEFDRREVADRKGAPSRADGSPDCPTEQRKRSCASLPSSRERKRHERRRDDAEEGHGAACEQEPGRGRTGPGRDGRPRSEQAPADDVNDREEREKRSHTVPGLVTRIALQGSGTERLL